MPILKKSSINNHKTEIRKKTYYKKTTFEIKKEGIIREHFIKKEKAKSEPNIFESANDFYSKMNRIEDTLLALIYKNNKITRQINQMKLIKIDELKSLRSDSNFIDKSKIYEELLNNYKDYNNDLNKKLNSLKKEKDTNYFINVVHKKIKLIVNTFNNINNNNKDLKKYGYILDKIKELLTKNNFKIKPAFIIEGIKIIEWIIISLMTEIKEHSKNYEEGNLIESLRYSIEKEKKNSHDNHQKDEIERVIKMNKLSKKMNKIIFISRKVPDKVDFTKIKKMEKK
jgi:hypothetical protein